MRLWTDLETRSPIPIKQGIAKYSTAVQIIMAQWAFDDGDQVVEDLTGSPPPSQDYQYALKHADELWAHGAEFEQQVLSTQSWYRALNIDLRKWRCTMALARMHGLPGGLDKLSTIFKLGLDEAKDKRGKELIQLFCVPKKDGTYNDRNTHSNEWREFLYYGGMDIVSMRAVWRKCPKWNATRRMWRVWHLDQKMNARGVKVDLKLAEGAVAATTRAKRRLAGRVQEITEYDELEGTGVAAATQRDRLLSYMADFDVWLPDLKADTVERRLNDENLPEHIKELLRIRQQASKASTAKYNRAITQHVRGRLRNLVVFCGAARTGRFAARTLQPHNFPRPKHEQWRIDQAIEFFKLDEMDLFDPDEVMGLAASCLRGLIIAEDGCQLSVADLANIEGRFMAWLAGEDWKLVAFAAYDRGEGPDLYKVSYARAFNIDPAEIGDKDPRRQIGKVMELALQYYGGVGAFCALSETYHLKLNDLAQAAWPVIPQRIKLQAAKNYARAIKRRRTYGLTERVWLVCESLVIMWREAHPKIVQFWHDLEKAVKRVIHNPQAKVTVGRVTVDRKQNWLRIRLPSGRYLSYPAPRSSEWETSFIGVNPYTRQWGRISTYSGKLAENIVQAGSADILMDGLLAADDAGFNPVLSVHDEIITEPPAEDDFNDIHLARLMVSNSPWTAGLPLAAKGFTAYRYAKP